MEYAVILYAEDGEYVLRVTNDLTSAVAFVEREKHNYGEGQSIGIREQAKGYYH